MAGPNSQPAVNPSGERRDSLINHSRTETEGEMKPLPTPTHLPSGLIALAGLARAHIQVCLALQDIIFKLDQGKLLDELLLPKGPFSVECIPAACPPNSQIHTHTHTVMEDLPFLAALCVCVSPC